MPSSLVNKRDKLHSIRIFLMEEALSFFPRDPVGAAFLSDQLEQIMMPVLKHRLRLKICFEEDRVEPFLPCFYEAMALRGYSADAAVLKKKFVPDALLKDNMPKIIESLLIVLSHHIRGQNTDSCAKIFPLRGGTLTKIIQSAKASLLFYKKKKQQMSLSDSMLVLPPFEEGIDFDTIDAGLPYGEWLLKMKSPSFLDEEGRSMKNCIGDGSANHDDRDEDHLGNYDSMLTDSDIGLYSYRDLEGPKIDFTVKDGVMVECEGRHKHRPARRFEPVMRQIVDRLGCRVAPVASSATRLVWQNGRHHNIFRLKKGFVLDSDLVFKNINRSFSTPQNMTVQKTLSFDSCQNDICLGGGLRAKHLKINLCKKAFVFGEGMSCSLLELDRLPSNLPERVRWDRVLYRAPDTFVAQEFSGKDFMRFLRQGSGLKRTANASLNLFYG